MNKKISVIADIGINHQGSVKTACNLVEVAKDAGCDYVKFQKRTPEKCVPESIKNAIYESPFGRMLYIDYRKKIELSGSDYIEIDRFCHVIGIQWFASAWDLESFGFLVQMGIKKHKIASAMLGNETLLKAVAEQRKHTYISTGMSHLQEIDNAVCIFENARCPYTLMACNSSYPCEAKDVNLKRIDTLYKRYPMSLGIGYSGHERGIQLSVSAAAMGACCIERHITLDRTMKGSDHAASLEPSGIKKLVRDIRILESAMGDGSLEITDAEIPVRKKLRYYE